MQFLDILNRCYISCFICFFHFCHFHEFFFALVLSLFYILFTARCVFLGVSSCILRCTTFRIEINHKNALRTVWKKEAFIGSAPELPEADPLRLESTLGRGVEHRPLSGTGRRWWSSRFGPGRLSTLGIQWSRDQRSPSWFMHEVFKVLSENFGPENVRFELSHIKVF
jgi:hypothetical protein